MVEVAVRHWPELSEHVTLGELVEVTKTEFERNPTRSILGLVDGHSYRGYYDQIAFNKGVLQVAEMYAEVRHCVGRVYEGYKGGDFTMRPHTLVWIAAYGETGRELTPAELKTMFGHGYIGSDGHRV